MIRVLLLLTAVAAFCLNAQGQSNYKGTNSQQVKVIGHAHMDPVYRWRWNEIERREVYKTFTDVLKVLDDYPGVQFAQSSLLYYSTLAISPWR